MSIQPHSMESDSLAIISAMKEHLSDWDNVSRHKLLMRYIDEAGIEAKEVTGYCKGSKELSIVVTLRDYEDFDSIIHLKELFGQESILLLSPIGSHGIRKASLYYDKDNTDNIGYFRSIPKELIKNLDNYTLDNETNTYYTTIRDYNKAVGLQA